MVEIINEPEFFIREAVVPLHFSNRVEGNSDAPSIIIVLSLLVFEFTDIVGSLLKNVSFFRWTYFDYVVFCLRLVVP